jgi:hypothetical protein
VWIDEHGGFTKGFRRDVFHRDDSRLDRRPAFPFTAGAFGSGANMAFDAGVLRRLDGFDPSLGTGTHSRGGDDLAAFLDVIRAGYSIVYEPAAIVRHTHSRDEDRLRRQAHNYGVGLSAYLTRSVAREPRAALQLARSAPDELAALLRRRHNGSRQSGVPSRLLWLELAGLVRGPFAYWHSCLHRSIGAVR